MRVLFVLAVTAVFGTMWVLDTTALVRLTVYCATGGCGVPPLWIVILAGVTMLAVLLPLRRSRAIAKTPSSRSSRAKMEARSKPEKAKQRFS